MTGESLDHPANEEQLTFDTDVAHVARVYNYWLGGTANYPADREAGEQAMAAYPDLPLRRPRGLAHRVSSRSARRIRAGR